MTPITNHKLVFFGTDAFSVPSLIRLVAEGWNIAAVITKPDSPAGRGREITMPAVKRLALAKAIPVLQPNRPSDILADLTTIKADAAIVVAYGKIIPGTILELFPKGLINVHPSLLPRYRGAIPIESAILNGDTETGVNLMKLDAGTDTGPTYSVAKHQLTGQETKPDLYAELAEMGADLLAADLAGILEGTIVPIPQDNTLATHLGRLSKTDGIIDWNKPATQLEREIRAYLGWPGSQTELMSTPVIITAAHISPTNGPAGQVYKTASSELAVYTNEGSLVIDQLKPAGKREMTGLEFLAGHPVV